MAEKKPTNDMNKRLSFKDFMTVEYKPGEDELVNYRAYRRRRLEDTDHSEYSLEDILEVISRGERMRRKRATKFGPLKHKMKRGRLKAKRRFVMFDSVNGLSIYSEPKVLREFINVLGNSMRIKEIYSMLMTVTEQTDEDLNSALDLLSDKIIR